MAVVASFANNQLSIVGDSAADTVVVSTVDVGGVAQVTVNGQGVGAGVDASAVTSIFANLGGGNDTMNLSTLDLAKFSGLTDGSIEIRGGAGNDTLVGSPLGDILKGEDGNDSLTGGAGNDQLIGGNGNDTLIGGAGDDTLDGGAGDDMYSFSGSTDLGSDTIVQAASGNLDTLGFGSLGGAIVIDISMTTPQVVRAGQLTLTLSDGAGIDNVQGTAYDDVILGNAGGNTLMGNGGNDYLWGRGGNDWLDGGAGNDTLYGGDGNDTLLGKGGNDSLYGHAGDDTLNGNEGNDYLSGDEGNDAYIVTNYGTKTIGAASSSDNDWLDLAGNASAAALDLSSTSVQAVAISLWVRFTAADAVSWVPGAGDNGTHAGGLYEAGYYTVPGVEGTTTTLAFTYGGAVAAYHNPVYIYDADALQPGQEPSGEYLFTGNETAEGTVVPRSYPAGTALGFYILQNGVDGFNGEARTRFYSENAKNTKDQNAEERQHVRAYDLSPTVLQLSWEDLFYVLPNPGGYRDTDFNDLWMSVEVVDYTAVDLDVDSDNANGLERSLAEDLIEDDAARLGVMVAVGGERVKMVVEVASGTTAQLTLANGDGKVTLWSAPTGGSDVLATGPIIRFAEPQAGRSSVTWTYWIEAVHFSQQIADVAFTLRPINEASGAELIETVLATAVGFDVAIDSNNDDTITDEDDLIEDIAGDDAYPGNKILVSNVDTDGDGLLDWADGFDWLAASDADNTSVGTSFEPMEIILSPGLNLSTTFISIEYDDSDPLLFGASPNGSPFNAPTDGTLRLWSIDSSSPRNPVSKAYGGHFIPSGIYSAAQVGLVHGTNRLYVEAVNPSSQTAGEVIEAHVWGGGLPSGVVLEDRIRITTSKIELWANGTYETHGLIAASLPQQPGDIDTAMVNDGVIQYNVRVWDPRANLTTVTVAGHVLPLTPSGAGYISPTFVVTRSTESAVLVADQAVVLDYNFIDLYGNTIDAPPMYEERPSDIVGSSEILALSDGAESAIAYNPEQPGVETLFKELAAGPDRVIADLVHEIDAELVADGWTSATPSDSGSFGKEMSRQVRARIEGQWGWPFGERDRWLTGVRIEQVGGDYIYRGAGFDTGTATQTEVDVMYLKEGYKPTLGQPIDQTKLIVYEIKTSATGTIDATQLAKLRAIQGGDIKRVLSPHKWLQNGNELVENVRHKRLRDGLAAGGDRLGTGAAIVSAVVAFASADQAIAALEESLENLKAAHTPDDRFEQSAIVMAKLRDVIETLSGGTLDGAANIVFLGYIYRVMIPAMGGEGP